MNISDISRRRFAHLAGAAAASLPLCAADAPTAQQVVERIQSALGGDWPPNGPDGFKAGDPATPVKGIATTAMATVAVLREASQAGANLILTYEPTFFGRQEAPAGAGRGGAGRGFGGPSPDDPVYKAKHEFIEKNGLVVFRLRDHWQGRKENDMVTGSRRFARLVEGPRQSR